MNDCTSLEDNNALKQIIFNDSHHDFSPSWKCNKTYATLRQRILNCDSMSSLCLNHWSCQQCIYGGTDIQCSICAQNYCFDEQCFINYAAYSCSHSLRAFQCSYFANECISEDSNHTTDSSMILNVTNNCKSCAIDDKNVIECLFCYQSCKYHPCWNTCSMAGMQLIFAYVCFLFIDKYLYI